MAEFIFGDLVKKANLEASFLIESAAVSREALVGERFKKIEFQENPLLFILAVVDTIEPYKIYSSKAADRDAVRIWKSIDISFTNNTLTLSSRYKCRPITKIYERAKGLEAWVDIESIELSSDRKSLRIKFK